MPKINRDNEALLTQIRLQELLHYNPDTGIFTSKVRRHRLRPGDIVGTTLTRGYIGIRVDGVRHLAHRLAFLYMTGRWPEGVVDHINGNAGDNRWSNLRECTQSQNMLNRKMFKNKAVPFKGVSLVGRRFKATIHIPGDDKTTFLGYFDTPEAANEAYMKEAKRLHGDFFKAA